MADPSFASVSLLLHCNGTDASTTFTDTSPTPKTVTANATAQVDTAQSKFGGASFLSSGNGDKLSVPDHTDFEVGTGAFTIEAWVRVDTIGTGEYCVLIDKPDGSFYTPYQLLLDELDGSLYFTCYDSTLALAAQVLHQTKLVADTWHHVAGTRSGNTFRVFLDGVVGSTTATSSASLQNNASSLKIGGGLGGSPPDFWLDEVRITKGVARYTATFTPPTTAFEEGESGGAVGLATETDTAFALTQTGVLPIGRANETDTALALLLAPQGRIADGGLPSAPSLRGKTLAGFIAAESMLGSAALRGHLLHGFIVDADLLGSILISGFTDFTSRLAVEQRQRYWMDLVTPTAVVRVPISSWQSTQQIDVQCYAGCVVPACTPYLTDLYAATEFVIIREATLLDGSTLEVEMVRCPLDTMQTDEGPTNHTASISGYFDAFPEVTSPDPQNDRTLTGIRSISVYSSGVRVRCEIDWLLRPGMRALYSTTSFVVGYINYYVTSNQASIDAYMDIGERA